MDDDSGESTVEEEVAGVGRDESALGAYVVIAFNETRACTDCKSAQ